MVHMKVYLMTQNIYLYNKLVDKKDLLHNHQLYMTYSYRYDRL